jgi:23S rRNA (adenine1618-N6)-methyltransferase
MAALLRVEPALARFLHRSPSGDRTIDFADPAAVKALNRALLRHVYGVHGWDIPEGYLCPPIPGRADYLHHLADLLDEAASGEGPRGSNVRVLDIGTGANLVYPLLGHQVYAWDFVGTEVDSGALDSAAAILERNPSIAPHIELRRQKDPRLIFEGVVGAGETFAACLCNPPFHTSLVEAREGTLRKWRNLGKGPSGPRPVLNFGGKGAELWCPGGEEGFLRRMVDESARMPHLCRWFTSLVSKSAHVPAVKKALRSAEAKEVRVIEMAQGQKQSRFVAWRFL